MKSPLQKQLAALFPSICIRTIWEHDTDTHPDIRKDCDGFEDEDPDEWQAWRSEVRVSVIAGGEEISASEYMGGTWEKWDAIPAESNPDISGYEMQMTRDALAALLELCQDSDTGLTVAGAVEWIKEYSRAEYEKQRAAAA